MKEFDIRFYNSKESVVFKKTADAYGGLSNMAGGYPVVVNGISIRTSEALYQSLRFPKFPDIQRKIIEERSPMEAKKVARFYENKSRADWEQVRVSIMRWCLRAKLLQNYENMQVIFNETNNLPIVEESRKDDFWGAIRIDELSLQGQNILGRLLMELREIERLYEGLLQTTLMPLNIKNFTLFNESIRPLESGSGIINSQFRLI